MITRAEDIFVRADDEEDYAAPRRTISFESLAQSFRNFATLSEALRFLGASVLVASMSVFLLQGWSQGNDVGRYLLLLAQTGLLTAAGLAMSHGLQESKGARVFFGVALISVPANFVILSALLYSVFQWDGGVATSYPDYALWQIDNLAGTGLVVGGALVVLLPVTLFCFAVMARRSALPLSLHFFLLNGLLLVPIRSSMPAGTIALIGIGYTLYILRQLMQSDRSLKTGEGKFALATLFIPSGIILFRSMYFYQVDALMVAMVSMALFLTARQVSLFPDRSDRVATVLEGFSIPVAFVAATSLTDALSPGLVRELGGPLFAVLYSLLALDVLRRTGSSRLGSFVVHTVTMAVALSFTFTVWAYPGALTAVLCVAAGAIVMFAGISMQGRLAMIAGTATLMAGLVFGSGELWRLVVTSSWIELAVFGAVAIVLGSVIDRHGVAIKLRFVKWFDAIGDRRERLVLED